ncbi:AAA family ATPase [Nocardiopsis sp. EMB25]|uniref:helix-turn-helix transcriptional regulator n=1 Tax=Nocardiopsis sp. EMB25 TaxID=2835867 RepID=UPI002283F8CF|nr:AAA family ATPase [Nocardiopsis sp. EMB25]MCY9784836.1 AAA family ATPase [Nocardiopsis sp. EMB25]
MLEHDPPSPLVGRDDHLARLARDARRTREDGARAVLLRGDAGVGKTRLIDEYLRRTPLARTAVGGCLELGADGVPFAPFTTLIRQLAPEEGAPHPAVHARELSRLVPELGARPDPADESRARLFESVLTLLEERAKPGGLAVVVEDLHWSDASTRDLLVFLLRNLGAVPLHLLVSVRTDDLHRTHPLRRLLPELQRLPRVGRLDVGPLTRDEVAAQAAVLRGHALTPADVDLLYERSGGNPLFVESLLAGPDPVGGGLPDGPRDLLLARVEALPDATRRLLGLAATAGEHVEHPVLAAAARCSGTSEEELERALRQAVDAQVLRATESGYSFRHALLAEAVYTDLLPGERVRSHRRYAEALEKGVPGLSETERAIQLAHHAHEARDQPLALTSAWRAADHAADAAAYPEHLALLERVLELWDRVPDAVERVGQPRGEVLRRAAEVSLVAGSLRRAVAHATDGLSELGVDDYHDPYAPPPADGELIGGLRHARAQALKELGRDGALEDLADAFIVLPDGHPGRGAVGATLAATLMMRGHAEQAGITATRVLAAARETGDRRSEADALITLGCLDVGDGEAGLELLNEGTALAREHGFVMVELRGLVNRGGVLKHLGRMEEALANAVEGLRRCEEVGLTRTQSGPFHAMMALLRLSQGRLDEVEPFLDQITGDSLIQARALTVVMELALVRWDVDRLRAAMTEFRRLLPESSSSPTEYLPIHFTMMRLAFHEGRATEALHFARELLDRSRGGRWQLPEDLYAAFLAEIAEVLVSSAEDPDRREEVGESITELRAALDTLRERPGHPGRRLAAGYLAGLIAEDPEEALASCEEALDLARTQGRTVLQAELLLVAVRAALRAGDRDRAAAHLAVVEGTAARYGLTLIGRQAALLRIRHGLAEGAPPALEAAEGATAAPSGEVPPAGLTRREAEVLAEVAQGRTNREIGQALHISAKTVSVHLTNLMAKLGVSNRNAAAVRARDLGIG